MSAGPLPRVAWRTVGQETALAALEPAVLSGEPAHAYLFTGPAGVGKTMAALEFAAALNCEGSPKPCRECRNCRDTLEPGRQHPDVEVVAPGGVCDESEHGTHEGSRDIRICQVRRLERVLSMTPYRGAWRVAIIDGAERLNQDASNAFLKTLEEPPPATVLVLVTDREEQLLETVLSRCRRVAFGRVDREKIEAVLAERGVEGERAAAIAALANGRLGWALRAIEDETLLSEREGFLDSARAVAHVSRPGRLAWAKAADERGAAVRERYLRELEVWEQWWRDVLSVAAGSGAGIINIDRSAALREEGGLYRPLAIVRFLRSLQKTREYLQANVDARLALEVLALDVPQPASTAGKR
ncbi:MAG TPA: DNA polymerase III subunit [Dehalococcoidia bacterium]|nr:DNA polymerase III subunit [Dehalococcoidia bacterium]